MTAQATHPSNLRPLDPRQATSASEAAMRAASIQDEETELIRRVLIQDQQAFDTLYARYAPRMRKYLSYRLQSAELIDEVLQDVMFVLWQHAIRIPPRVPLVAWLCGIARNQTRKTLARQTLAESAAQNPHDLIDANEPETVLLHQEDQQALIHMLDRLPHHEQQALKLRLFQGQSYQDIALATGDSESTIRTRVSRACRRLSDTAARRSRASDT